MSRNKIFYLVIGLASIGLASYVLYHAIVQEYTFGLNSKTLKIIVFYLIGIVQVYKAFSKEENIDSDGK